jgi:hypothetical protein
MTRASPGLHSKNPLFSEIGFSQAVKHIDETKRTKLKDTMLIQQEIVGAHIPMGDVMLLEVFKGTEDL